MDKILIVKCYKNIYDEVILFNKVTSEEDELYTSLKNFNQDDEVIIKYFGSYKTDIIYIPKNKCIYQSKEEKIHVESINVDTVIIRPLDTNKPFLDTVISWIVDFYGENSYTIRE